MGMLALAVPRRYRAGVEHMPGAAENAQNHSLRGSLLHMQNTSARYSFVHGSEFSHHGRSGRPPPRESAAGTQHGEPRATEDASGRRSAAHLQRLAEPCSPPTAGGWSSLEPADSLGSNSPPQWRGSALVKSSRALSIAYIVAGPQRRGCDGCRQEAVTDQNISGNIGSCREVAGEHLANRWGSDAGRRYWCCLWSCGGWRVH